MSATTQIVASNQEFVDKVIKENEAMVEMAASLKAQIAETRKMTEKCRTQTMKLLEPKIQKLLEDHKHELETQKANFRLKIESEKSRADLVRSQHQIELDKSIEAAKEKCAQKISKMKHTIETRSAELKAAIDSRLEQIPSKMAEKQQVIAAEEEIIRKEWEKIITDKLASEFHSKKAELQKDMKAKREQRVLEIIGELESQAREESNQMAHQIEKERSEHQIYMRKLQRKLDEKKLELSDLQSDHSLDLIDEEIAELKDNLSNCQCDQYRTQIDNVMRQIAAVEDECESVNLLAARSRREHSSELDAYKSKLADLLSEQTSLKGELAALERQKKDQSAQLQSELDARAVKHREQINAIGERVKSTVTKKDQVIADLRAKLECLGRIKP